MSILMQIQVLWLIISAASWASNAEIECDDDDYVKLPGWSLKIFVKEPYENQLLNTFMLNAQTLSFDRSLSQIIEDTKMKRFKFPGVFATNLGTNHLQILSEDAHPYKVPDFEPFIESAVSNLLKKYIKNHAKNVGKILDLCSSWTSHLPDDVSNITVIGLGMNTAELKANPSLSEFHVQDLNEFPHLDTLRDASMDLVLCSFSIELLTRVMTISKHLSF